LRNGECGLRIEIKAGQRGFLDPESRIFYPDKNNRPPKNRGALSKLLLFLSFKITIVHHDD
jgi:hypothetical protein